MGRPAHHGPAVTPDWSEDMDVLLTLLVVAVLVLAAAAVCRDASCAARLADAAARREELTGRCGACDGGQLVLEGNDRLVTCRRCGGSGLPPSGVRQLGL